MMQKIILKRAKSVSQNIDDWVLLYLVTGLLSALVFCLIYGVHILNPTYADWILAEGGDPSQHYLGWVAYRSSKWSFPLCMTDQLLYPYEKSIMFTDSLPLLAIFFKILSPILPETFQYFGIWGISCFILQGVLSARIFKNFTNNRTGIVLASLLMVLAPVMLYRMYMHTALAGQWLILLALQPVFDYRKQLNSKKIIGFTALIGVLSVSIHLYFVPMCGIVVIGLCLLELLYNKSGGLVKAVRMLVSFLGAAVFTVWVLGGFSSDITASVYGLGVGINSFNLNGFFNPQSWSCLLKDLSLYDDNQYEGFAYLGAGCIAFLIASFTGFFLHKGWKDRLRKHAKLISVLIVIVLLSMMAALSPTITIGNMLIVDIPVPDIVMQVWQIFRSSGRISWVAVYVINLCSCIVLLNVLNYRIAIVCMAAGLAVQVYDIHDQLISRHIKFNNTEGYDWSIKEEDIWMTIGEDERFSHVVYVDTFDNDMDYLRWMAYNDWALSYEMTVSNFYFARSVDEEAAEVLDYALENLPEDAAFIFSSNNAVECLSYDLYYYEVKEDNVIVGLSYLLDGYELADMTHFTSSYIFKDGFGLSAGGGEDTQEGREIYPDGWSWGPFWEVAEGEYTVEIRGEGLDGAEIQIYADGGSKALVYELLEKSNEKAVYSLYVDEAVHNSLEIPIHNSSGETILIQSIVLSQAAQSTK